MGSCFSTTRKSSPPPPPPLAGRDLTPEPEEETVKEVLSETPAARSLPEPPAPVKQQENLSASVCESEISFCSETPSVSTATAENKPEPEVTKAERSSPAGYRTKRSFSGELPRKPGGGARASPSPVRRACSAREAPAPAQGPRVVPQRRAALPAAVKLAPERRGSGVRSMSAPRRINGNGYKASPRRETGDDSGGRRTVVDKPAGSGGKVAAEEGSESLENPLVSMECFIFL